VKAPGPLCRWLPVAPALLVGCGEGGPPPTFTVEDSLGVQVVQLHQEGLPEGLQVEENPELVLGDGSAGFDGLDLHRVVGARLLADGVVVIADEGSQQLIRIDLGAGAVDRWGGPGDGPEEFRGLSGVFDVGDERVGAYDRARRRFVELDRDGRLTGEVILPTLAPDPPTVIVAGEGTDAPRPHAAFITGLPRTPVTGPWRGVGPVVPLDSEADTIALIRGHESFVAEGAAGAVLFARTTLVAGGPDGLWIGDTERRSVELLDGPGEVLRVVRWTSDEPLMMTEERQDRVWQALEERSSEPERSMIGQMRAILPAAEQAPAFGSLVAGPPDRLWIGESIPPEVVMLEEPWPAQEWIVVNFAEESAQRVTTPPGFRLLQAGEGFLLGVHRSELGVETVRLHRLR
jgi:hypothetical protein